MEIPLRTTCRSGTDQRTSIPNRLGDVLRLRTRVCGFRASPSSILAIVIGILGGTFDPPHIAHLAIAHAAYEQLDLSEVLLMPAGDPWQKAATLVTSTHDRFAMTTLAAAEATYLTPDDREIERVGPTYTADTVSTFDSEVVVILGADAALGIPGWHRGNDLIASTRFAVVPRKGIDRSEVDRALNDRVSWVEMPFVDISSTEIRNHISRGYSPRFLVPEPVVAYIEARGLYGSSVPSYTVVPIIAHDE